jgi:serine/threonine protein kinase
VLGNESVTGSCDLWAVGCIIFQMLSGSSPFRAPSEYLTFNMIMSHCDGSEPLKYPPTIGSHAEDLIRSLLSGDPVKRLGAGFSDDSDGNSFEKLCAHPFFIETDASGSRGVSVSSALADLDAPYIPPATSKYDMRDGADDDWLSDGDATPIDEGLSGSGGHSTSSRKQTDAEAALAAASGHGANGGSDKADKSSATFWKAYLNPGEEHVFTGVVWKRKVIVLRFIC